MLSEFQQRLSEFDILIKEPSKTKYGFSFVLDGFAWICESGVKRHSWNPNGKLTVTLRKMVDWSLDPETKAKLNGRLGILYAEYAKHAEYVEEAIMLQDISKEWIVSTKENLNQKALWQIEYNETALRRAKHDFMSYLLQTVQHIRSKFKECGIELPEILPDIDAPYLDAWGSYGIKWNYQGTVIQYLPKTNSVTITFRDGDDVKVEFIEILKIAPDTVDAVFKKFAEE